MEEEVQEEDRGLKNLSINLTTSPQDHVMRPWETKEDGEEMKLQSKVKFLQ